MKKLLTALTCLLLISACSGIKSEAPTAASAQDARENARGKITGEEGLIVVGNSKDKASSASPLGVNSFLWRATLDTLSFMPLTSADPFGGVIITDWYEDPNAVGTRFKINALILDKTLRADGVKISVFKQAKSKTGGWKDQVVDTKLSRTLEETILTRARELKINQGK